MNSTNLLKIIDRKSYWKQINSEMGTAKVMGEGDYLSYVRELGLIDIFFFLVVILRRRDADNDFVYEVCRDLEGRYNKNQLNNILHLYARGHFKSSIITIAYTVRDLLIDSERTFCIFSNTNAAAETRVTQLKGEFENNELLKTLYPETCWKEPERESPRWSIQKGLVLKRKGNPQEASIEGWGILDGMPTGRHFTHMIYDDLVTEINVGTPEQIQKTTERWGLSLSLDSINKPSIKRYIGTRYHYSDTYKDMMDRGMECIIRPATRDGKPDGELVLMTREIFEEKTSMMTQSAINSQLFLNPMQASIKNFEASWIQRYENMSFTNMNKYILVDPASKKTKSSDYTVILVMGLNEDGRYYLIDGVRDRLGLSEKWDRLYSLVKRHKPLHVGYEEYGMVADIEYLRMKMEEVNYRFQVVKLGKKIKKEERILALQPLFKESKIWLPQKILFQDYEGRSRDLVREFIEDEYMFFPYCSHDDMLDCMARIVDIDMGAVFPETQEIDVKEFFCKDEYKYY